ncbi:MAG: DNA replication protein [Pelagibacterales bacterium]|jgi:chromosomal replication initiation ATPase DnaA|nr:DNA replication protein [Pelagibacterales bacterium]
MNSSVNQQLILNLRSLPSMGRNDYFVSEVNKEAVSWLDSWPNWTTFGFIVCGPLGSGKSHLAQVLRTLSHGDIIEAKDISNKNIDQLSEKKCLIIENLESLTSETLLFHLYNMLLENKNNLMLTSKFNMSQINFELPDLKSRLLSMPQVNIDFPDDRLLKNLLIKQFLDKGILVEMDVIDYLIKRIDRSFEAISKLVAKIDFKSLEKAKKITIPFIKNTIKL